ncbi:DNA polymerase iota-like [Ylistrum balloti]|uniref:DNA polymerase iota-like n=1 Tax=Ylistrum balloti TaxID=509963 RepID=UPI002905D20F|nr:DNA polymerase iota-like [Ylistrum balloti]
MDDHGEDFEENEDESWSLPFSGDTPHPISSIDVGSPGGKVITQERKLSGHNHMLSNYGDLCVSALGHTRTIIHIDIDCFYAQVEMMRNPKLRDKPLGIQQKYIVVTCNYVARRYGVTKLMGINEALDRCPNLVLVKGEDLTHYRQVSYRISEFLQQYTHHVERLGMDENFLDVSDLVKQRQESGHSRSDVMGHQFLLEQDNNTLEDDKGNVCRLTVCNCGCRERLTVGSQIAADIRDALHQELDITCCAGISYSKLLSKLVAGKHKPNQQTTLFPEQTAKFMATVGQVRRIPGIGSTTSKKLAALGIVTLQDLQQFDLSVLKQELGPKQAVVIQQLSFGIDDSPVVTFGRPQTLSDEDSFKRCSTIEDARSKVKELLTSLTKRLLDDGRTPQTLRLTIRKLTTADKKWTNRESRQCPIPGHVMSSLSSDKLERLIDHLEEITMTLFSKLVNIKDPFHLTLMNIAFCSLVEKSKNAISSFFTVRSPRDNVDDVRKTRETGQKSPITTLNKGKQQNILQKWVLKSPEKSRQHSQELFGDKQDDGQVKESRSFLGCSLVQAHLVKKTCGESHTTTGCVSSDSVELPVISCRKRKPEESIEETRSHSSKRSIGRNVDGGNSYTTPNRVDCSLVDRRGPETKLTLPNDVDMEVFLQLPRDIQGEILQEAQTRKDEIELNSTGKTLNANRDMELNNSIVDGCSKSCVKDHDEFTSRNRGGKTLRKDTEVLPQTFCVSSIPSDIQHDQSKGTKPKEDRKEDFSSNQLTSEHLSSVYIVNMHSCINADRSLESENVIKTESIVSTTEKRSRDILHLKTNDESRSETNIFEKTDYDDNIDVTNSDSSVNTYQLPPHIDKEVFSNLPSEIQNEYISQWSRVPIPKRNSTQTMSQDRHCNPKHKPNGGKSSILNFFQSKNKR